uniref:CdiI immunity protein domain-containing protein n=1 Tax=Streptomyces sp. NBC_01393 TaxID=2903851 RepID=A0AAU3I9U5_9ACTN
MSRYELNEREAFVAMSRFLWQFANRAGDDLLTLLGDIGIEADGQTTDPAAWEDWMKCVRSVVDGTEDPAGGSAG